jgi:L-threonylcarbamoyladenylate synthase
MQDESKGQVIRVDLQSTNSGPDREWIDRAVGIVKSGGIIAFPTETFYGLGVDPLNSDAVSRLFRIKDRDPGKAINLVVDDIDRARGILKSIPPHALDLIQNFWPGPLTILFSCTPEVPSSLTGGTGKIGIRVPSHPVSLHLLRAMGQPVTATSANRSGHAPARTAKDVEETFGREIDLVLDGGPTPGGKTSTVVDATLRPPRLIREGQVPFGEVLRCLGLTPTEDHEW